MSNNTSSIRIPVDGPGTDGLKAERVQEAFAPALPGSGLKAERVQLAFRDLPGWRIQNDARFIERTFELGSVSEVVRFLQYVTEVGTAGEILPDFTVRSGKVTLEVPMLAGGWIEGRHFELAQAFEAKPA